MKATFALTLQMRLRKAIKVLIFSFKSPFNIQSIYAIVCQLCNFFYIKKVIIFSKFRSKYGSNNKVALVTGGASGLGQATVEAYVAKGAKQSY